MKSKYNSFTKFLTTYKEGQRHFKDWELDTADTGNDFHNMILKDIFFEGCYLSTSFRKADLTNATFLNCNLKTADFRYANLTNATIKNCHLECADFKNSITDGLMFRENYLYASIIEQEDFDAFF